MPFVANFTGFPAVKKSKVRLTIGRVTRRKFFARQCKMSVYYLIIQRNKQFLKIVKFFCTQMLSTFNK